MALTGFWLNAVCAPDAASVVQLFASTFPNSSNGYLFSAANPAFIAPNFIGAWIQSNNLLTGAIGGAYQQFPLVACDPTLSVSPVIDAASILEVFGWGFGAVVLFFCFGYWIAVALQAIKKAS